MALGSMMAGGNPSNGRQENDHYPTPPDVTRALLKLNPFPAVEHVWEPCAGDGAMARVLKTRYPHVLMSDIAPKPCEDVIQEADFFDVKFGFYDTIITNPPFNLAEKFILHAFDNLNIKRLALVLKSTYWHAASRQALFQKHPPQMVCPLTWRPDFLGLGRPTMEAQWCVWNKTLPIAPTLYVPLRKPD